MTNSAKIFLLEVWAFVGVPLAAIALMVAFRFPGLFLGAFLIILWGWELFAFAHYRFCRQEEFLSVLQTAAATQAPLETTLRAYLQDRPREHLYRGFLLLFVFPGYYWIHLQRSFDHRLRRLADLLESGVPLDHALRHVPGVVSREIAMSISVGQFSGKLPAALARVPDRRVAHQWLELMPRLMYPAFILVVLVAIVSFLMIFIIPKFESIFLGFKMKLPFATELIISVSRWLGRNPYLLIVAVLLFGVFNNLLYSSKGKWYCPGISWIYRMYTRGQFLQTLGLMLESGKPLPMILDCVVESKLLPTALVERVDRLASDIEAGQPLPESLAKHGLITGPMQGLVASAAKAQNLPWALKELGDSLVRRSARLSFRIVMVLFPLLIFVMACLIGFVGVSMFSPLVEILDRMAGQ